MNVWLKSLLVMTLLAPAALGSEPAPAGTLAAQVQKIDAWAANPDTRLAMISAMADELKVHRNHLILLRKQTGLTYGQIFVSSLEKAGLAQSAIVSRAAALTREVDRRLGQPSTGEAGSARLVRPVLSVATGVDYNSAATFYWLTPEGGIDSTHASLIFGAPYYRSSKTAAVAGVGDAYATGAVYGRVARADLEAELTVGFPTGDKNRGLGAGKLTADITGTIAHRFERVRPFVSAGFANSIFNFAYQRPYVADGNVAHFSGGAEFRAARRVTFGIAGFAVRPFGAQVVYSRVMTGQDAGSPANGGHDGGPTPNPGMSGMGGGMPGSPESPETREDSAEHMPFLRTQQSVVSAGELTDHGANAWMSFMLGRGLFLHVAFARSVPFQLTTARVGLSFDVGRVLFH